MVASRDLIIDVSTIDFNRVVADIELIRKYNPQRFEMEQLTAVVYEDTSKHICVGYKDTSYDEFWVRGHMPNMPLMPGVIMLEAAAQMCSYYVQRHDLMGAEMVGFGGLEDVRFRDPVIPGSRLILLSQLAKVAAGTHAGQPVPGCGRRFDRRRGPAQGRTDSDRDDPTPERTLGVGSEALRRLHARRTEFIPFVSLPCTERQASANSDPRRERNEFRSTR